MLMNMRKQILSVVVLFIAACAFTSCNTSNAETKNDTKKVMQQEQPAAPATAEVEAVPAPDAAAKPATSGEGKVVKLTTQMFIDQIFDYKANPTKWVYKGDKPAIIDFYADWCGPCKRVAPIMEELAGEYAGQINIYKIDTDHERELAGQVFGIRSIPSILFIPVDGQPTMYTGAFPKEHYVELINTLLLNKK
jgi:thioredoxin